MTDSLHRKICSLERQDFKRRLCEEPLNDLISARSKCVVWVGTCVTHGGLSEMLSDSLVEKPEGKKLPGMNMYGWKDNIKVDLEGKFGV